MEKTKKVKALFVVGDKMRQIKDFALKNGIDISEAKVLEMMKSELIKMEIEGLAYAEQSIRDRLEAGETKADILANKVIADLRKRKEQIMLQGAKEKEKRAESERVLP